VIHPGPGTTDKQTTLNLGQNAFVNAFISTLPPSHIPVTSDSIQVISVALPWPQHIQNMGHPQFFSIALLLLLVCTLLPAVVLGNKKTGIFNKIADTTRDLQATATGGASGLLGQAGRFSLDGFMDAFEELTDKQWGTPKTTLDSDLIGLMRDVFVQDESHTRLLQEAWADPEILRALMDDLPMFDVIKPLRALKEKKEALTARDVSELANNFFSLWVCVDSGSIVCRKIKCCLAL
jgi:hypothetical protein